MDGIEKITGRIQQDASAEVEAVLAAAREQAAAIAADAAQKAAAETAKIAQRSEQAAAELVSRRASVDALEAKKALLGVKQEMISTVFDRTLEALCALPEDDYVALLARLAVGAVTSGEESLIFSAGDRSRVGKKVVNRANELLEQAGKNAALTLDAESRPVRGGLYVRSGRIEANCTLETIVRLMRETASGEVAARLFA
ncbi:MAG: V-type ATP synthase subunit E family protein [Oscillospiraceae bacterium]|nr:V-type ATP synthase subunit E family protein [Oscillospiraceae bacterium]